MLDLKFIRANLGKVKDMLKSRGYDLDISLFESADKERREILKTLESLRHQRNRVSEQIADMKKKGEDIPLAARIVAIVDVYDALTSRRPYKSADSHEAAIEIMKKESFKFDPDLFKAFYENADEFNKIRKQFTAD